MHNRQGTLEVIHVDCGTTSDGWTYHCKCLVHRDKAPIRLSAKQFKNARRCSQCAVDAESLRYGTIDLTGKLFGDFVALHNVGLSTGARSVKSNQSKWKGTADLEHTYNRSKYWLCYCIHCHRKRKFRGDSLRNNIPRCKCKK